MVEVFARWARLTGRLAVIGERSPSDWRRCGAGMNRPAAALKGYATVAKTTFCGGDSSLRYRSEATYGDSSADTWLVAGDCPLEQLLDRRSPAGAVASVSQPALARPAPVETARRTGGRRPHRHRRGAAAILIYGLD